MLPQGWRTILPVEREELPPPMEPVPGGEQGPWEAPLPQGWEEVLEMLDVI